MQKFDILGALESMASTNGWVYLMGNNEHQNYEASQIAYSTGQYVLGADFISSEVYNQYGSLSEINYVGTIRFGRKFDEALDGTHSSLDETFRLKYNRRLLELKQALSTYIENFACSNRLSVTSLIGSHDLNRFDTNIDFTVVQVTFNQNDWDYVPPATYQLIMQSSNDGISNPMPATYTHQANRIVPLYAIPNNGYSFLYWLINGVQVLDQLTYVKMTENKTIKPFFIGGD